MDQPEQDLRSFARQVQQEASLRATAPTTDSQADKAVELRGLANVLLERGCEETIRARLEAIRDKLLFFSERRGRPDKGKSTGAENTRKAAAALQALARELEAALDDQASSTSLREIADHVARDTKIREARREIEQAIARIDHAVQGCCWKNGLCETQFEPFLPGDREHTWFARLRSRLPEFSRWLVEQRFLPLLVSLRESAPLLGVEVTELIEIDIPATLGPARAKPRKFMRDCMRQLAANVDDESVRRAVTEKLGAAFAQDPDRVPPLFFLEYFEVLRGTFTRRGDEAVTALTRPNAAAVSPPPPDAKEHERRSPALTPERNLPPGVRCGSDFSWIQIGPVTYRFKKGHQAETVRVLFEESKKAGFRDGCALGEKVIANLIGASDTHFTIRHTFRGNEAKDVLIRRVKKGQWALFFQPMPK